MEVVTGATSSVLSKLGTLLQEEYYLQKGVKKDVESLQNELIFMRAALCKVAEVPPEKLDTQVKAWAGNIKELSYDMKDAVDTYEVRVAGNGIDGDQYCTWIVKMVDTVNKIKARHLLAGVIAEMKALTVQVAELRDRYKLDNIAASTSSITTGTSGTGAAQDINVSIKNQLWTGWRPRAGEIISSLIRGLIKAREEESQDDRDDQADTAQIPPLVGMKDPVGVDHHMKVLGDWMMTSGSEKGNRVRCILGVGGVGKTTVATALYRKYGDRFDLRATVTVSLLSSCSSDGTAVVSSIQNQVMRRRRQGGNGAKTDNAVKTVRCFNTETVVRCLKRRGRTQGSASVTPEENGTDTKFKELLQNKSCLLLLDDIRSEKTWREISGSLLQHLSEKSQSRIIITTRSPAVAAACDKSSTHKMEGIHGKESRKVFMEALSESRNGRKDGDHRKETSNSNIPLPARLWEMCVNHPVAITAMAGHVACNPHKSAEEWRKVCSDLLPDSVEAINRDGVPRILRHCYHDMPAEIKTCFLYLGMYPKGRNISRKHLARRWIAEGFVGEKPGKSVEQVADDYFDQLICRKMVQAVEQSSNGKVKSCKVYQVVHDFIVSMASEENLVTVVGGDGSSYMSLPPSGGKVRRLSLSLPANGGHENAAQSLNMSHVRSLAVFDGLSGGGEDSIASSPPQPLISPDSPILQVLDLEGCKGVQQQLDMSVLCSMLLLKYLSLRRTDIEKLPREIGKLSKLETLDVRETNITELPSTVWHLDCLVCILGGDKTTRKPLKLPAKHTTKKKAMMMRSLRVLSGVEITDQSLEHLNDLTKLRKLAIYKLDVKKNIEDLWTWIERLGNNYLHTLLIISPEIQSIAIKNSSFKELTALNLSGGIMHGELPEWIKQLGVLTKLTLPITLLRSDTFNNLESMSSLFSLTFSLSTAAYTAPVTDKGEVAAIIKRNKEDSDEVAAIIKRNKADLDEVAAIIERNKADSDGEIIVPAAGFKRLQILRFSAPSMPPLSFLDNAMPNLERLELRSSFLEGLFGIENLKKLKEVHLSVHVGADQFTKSLVENIAAAATQYYKSTRIIRDEYQD